VSKAGTTVAQQHRDRSATFVRRHHIALAVAVNIGSCNRPVRLSTNIDRSAWSSPFVGARWRPTAASGDSPPSCPRRCRDAHRRRNRQSRRHVGADWNGGEAAVRENPGAISDEQRDVVRLVIGDHDVDAAVAGQIACRQRRRMRATGCRRRHRESAASVTEEREQLSGVPGDHKISGTVGVDAGRQRRRRSEAGRQLETHRRREWSSRAAHCDRASGPHANLPRTSHSRSPSATARYSTYQRPDGRELVLRRLA
jgi:hypothetical protein